MKIKELEFLLLTSLEGIQARTLIFTLKPIFLFQYLLTNKIDETGFLKLEGQDFFTEYKYFSPNTSYEDKAMFLKWYQLFKEYIKINQELQRRPYSQLIIEQSRSRFALNEEDKIF